MDVVIWLALLWPILLSRVPEEKRPLWMRRSLLLLLSLLSLRYLHWRCTESLNLESPTSTFLSLLLLTAEAWLLISGLVPILLSWKPYGDGRLAAIKAEAQWEASDWRPWVDVLIPTCGEPLQVLERCLQGCNQLIYKNRTLWVLDDAGRAEVKELAAQYGCCYQHRSGCSGAKAGNLNAGLANATGELVAVFDADFIPQKHFLNRCIGLLLEPNVGLVQTPQCFFNADPIMRNLGLEAWLLPDEESFYRWIEPVRSAWGAVVCAGTSFVARRSALDDVGGFIENAISEDFVTGTALTAKGWRLLYTAEKLSAGLAAETMLDFVRQRQRWAAGTIQALRLPQGPLRVKGLSMKQRLVYLEGALHWFNTIPRLILLLMPLSIGLLGVLPVHFTTTALLTNLLPLWLAFLLSVGWLNRGSRHALLAELPGWVLAIPLASTVFLSLAGKILPFRITPKHRVREKGGIAMELAMPLLVLMLINGINLLAIISALNIRTDAGSGLGLFWASLNLLGLLVALRVCWDRPCPDPTPWFKIHMEAYLLNPAGKKFPVKIDAISEKGADLRCKSAWPQGPGWKLMLDDETSGTRLPMAIPLGLITPGSILSVNWLANNLEEVKALKNWLFSRPKAWPDRQAAPEWKTFFILLSRLAWFPKTPKAGSRSLIPQQITGAADCLHS